MALSLLNVKQQRPDQIFSNYAIVRNIAGFVNDHHTLLSLASTNRFAAEFTDDSSWKYLSGLGGEASKKIPAVEKPPYPFPSFQSYFRTFKLHQSTYDDDDKEGGGVEDIDEDEEGEGGGGGGKKPNSSNKKNAETVAKTVKHLALPRGVEREGQQIFVKGYVQIPQLIRFGSHLKKLHLLLVDRPEQTLIGLCSSNCPSASHSVESNAHRIWATDYLLPGFIIDIEVTLVESTSQYQKQQNRIVVNVTNDYETVSTTRTLIDEVAPAGFDQICVALCANNSRVAVL